MIKFKKVRFKNFFNFGNDFTEIDIEQFDFVCITGENGVGKSTIIIESIFFALFGKSFRKINKPNIVNNINKKNCEVQLWFSKNNKDYYIRRGVKPSILEIFEGKKQLESKSSDTELQDYFEEKILQFTDKIFKQVCLFGSALYVPFLELTLPERRIIVENLLGLEIFSSIQAIIKDKIKEINLKVNEDENKIEKYTAELNTLTKAIEEIKKDNQKQIKEYQDSIKQLENSKKEYDEYINKCNTEIEKFKKEQKGITEKSVKYETQFAEGSKLLNERSNNGKGLESEIKIYENQLKQLEGKSECPLCHSKADNFKDLIDNLKSEIGDRMKKIDDIQKECEEINKIADNIKEKIKEYAKLIDNLNDKLGDKRREVSINETKKSSCDTTIKEHNGKIEELEDKTVIDENEIKHKEDLIDECNRVMKEHNETLEYYNIIKDMSSDKGIKIFIIQKYIPIINNQINNYLEKFELGFNFEFDDQFNDKIVSRIKEGIVFNGLSQGQKSKINFSIMFSFIYIAQLLNSVNCDILFMDEVLDSNSLDEKGVENLLGLIKNVSEEEQKRVWVISHNERTKDLFDQRINVIWNGLFGKVNIG